MRNFPHASIWPLFFALVFSSPLAYCARHIGETSAVTCTTAEATIAADPTGCSTSETG
jgi:hypothetical protein